MRANGSRSPDLLEALRRVTRGANPEWAALVLVIVQLCAILHAMFSTDEVHALLAALGDAAPQTREKRALGPVMLTAQQKGWIAPSELQPFQKSERKENHGRPVRVWRSLLHGTVDARPQMLAAIAALESGSHEGA